jgi:uncharacterized protein YkwD
MLGGVFSLPAAASNIVCPAAAPADMIGQVLQITNKARASEGLAPLKNNAALNAAAQKHACDMVSNNFFDHKGRDGSNSMDRAKAHGFKACTAAENIAWGKFDGITVTQGFLGSPGHRANIMLGRLSHMGFGYVPPTAGREAKFVQLFGRSC